MLYTKLGHTDIQISKICLGTMTWGEQNTEEEAHEQMSYALDAGVNFFDTAEMYPVPPRQETQGTTEKYIGSWFQKTKCRDKVILATKAAGPSEGMKYVRGGPRFSKEQLTQAVDTSLERLQTDYIDLYQLHWPARAANFFGQLGYSYVENDIINPIEETLEALDGLVKTGKIRCVGLSNETPWGVMKFLQLAEKHNWPRVVSIQNPYNLLNRTYEVGLAEVSHREKVGLLAYSPLGFGVLSGKYMDGQKPPKARLTLYSRFSRYINEAAKAATAEYVRLASEYQLDPAQMALAFVTQRGFVTSNIIGATTMEQLKSNIASAELKLSEELLADIETVHTRIPNPSP